MPAVSIIIPVYNTSKYLSQCIECALNQTLSDIEVILVDDGSTDDSGEIIDRYARKDSRVRAFHKENEGAGPTRNVGIANARGEYLYFPDSDDWYDQNTLQELYAMAKAHNADSVISGVYGAKPDARGQFVIYNSYLTGEHVFATQEECRKNVMEFFPTTLIFDSPCNKLYRRQVVVDHGLRFTNLRRCQDAVWNLDFYDQCSVVVSTPKAYYYYRENTQELVQRKFPPEYFDIQMRYFRRLRELMTRWGIYSGWVREHYDTSMVMAVDTCARMYDNPRWGFSRLQRRDYIRHCLTCPEVREYLPKAHVRSDQMATVRRILRGDVAAVMRTRRRQRLMERLRRLPFVAVPYRALRQMFTKR